MMLQTGACNTKQHVIETHGYIKTLSTTIKKEKLPFYTRQIMISMSGNRGLSNTHKQTPMVLVVIRRVSIGTNGKAPYSNGSIGEYAPH